MTNKKFNEITRELKNIDKMYKHVINDIIANSNDREGINLADRVKTYSNDILSHGCSSGIVSSMICCADTVKFFKRYKKEITKLFKNSGYSIYKLYRFDYDDPFCKDMYNQNIIAWFAYEQIANDLYISINIE